MQMKQKPEPQVTDRKSKTFKGLDTGGEWLVKEIASFDIA